MVVRSLALWLALTTLPAVAQNNFTITVHGKPSGKASYSIDKTKDGFHVKSKVSYRLSAAATTPGDAVASTKGRSANAAPGLAGDFQFVEDYKLDTNSSYTGGFMMNMVSFLIPSYTPSKSPTPPVFVQTHTGLPPLTTPLP